MIDWKPIETAPDDGTTVWAGAMSDMPAGFVPYPLKSRFHNVDGWLNLIGANGAHATSSRHIRNRYNRGRQKVTIRKLAVLLAAVVLVTAFEITRVYYGNPVIDEIADHGSDGLNTIDPCIDPNIFC